MARAFVAVVPPRGVLDAVRKVSWRAVHRPAEMALPRLLSPRWTTREQWHLTLQFLGNRVDLDEVATALATVRAAPVRVRLGGIGGFPSERRAERSVGRGDRRRRRADGPGRVRRRRDVAVRLSSARNASTTRTSRSRVSVAPPTCARPRRRPGAPRSARAGSPTG